MTEFFGHVLVPMKNMDLPYSISLHGTLHLTHVSLTTFSEGKTYLYVKVRRDRFSLCCCLLNGEKKKKKKKKKKKRFTTGNLSRLI